jgi:hypothetical protein
MLQNKDFKITTDITLLWISDEEKVNELFESKEGHSKMIKDINKLYGTKIKKIIYVFRDVERLGYNIFYTE